MGLNFRRSMKIAPGIRLNFSKNGIGASFGPRGAKYSISPTGRRTISTGIPGTGISYREQINSTAKSSRSRRARYSTQYADNTSRAYSRAHPFIGGFLILVALGTISNGFTTWNQDKATAIVSFIIALAMGFVGAFIYRSRKYPEQPGMPSELDNLMNSRFIRDPLDLSEWELTNKEYTRFVELLNKSAEQISDNSEAPSFPVQKDEVLFAKFTGAITDFDGLEQSETGTIYITDKRITFIGATETEEWKFDYMSGPVGQPEKRVMTFPLTNRKKVSGVVIINDDWSKFIFVVEMAVGSNRFGAKAIAYWNQELGEYQKKKPKVS